MGKLVLIIVAAALLVLGLRFRSQVELEERVHRYQHALEQRALAARSGMRSVPTEAELQESAQSLAQELGVTVRDVRAEVQENSAPVGLGGRVAEEVGALAGRAQVDAEGNVGRGPALRLRTTLARLQAHVSAKGFLCSLEREVAAARNFGYALR